MPTMLIQWRLFILYWMLVIWYLNLIRATGNAHITSIVSSRIEGRAHPCRKPARDTLISVERNAIFGNLDSYSYVV